MTASDVTAIGFVPSTPLLVPELAGSAPGDPDAVRSAATQVVDELLAQRPDRVVVVAPSPAPGGHGVDPTWDFSGFGLSRPDAWAGSPLPWQLGLGAWLLDYRGWDGPREFLGVLSPGSEATDADDGRTAYLAVGDGSVCLPDQPPDGAAAEREAFDAAVARALAAGDAPGLAASSAPPADAVAANGPAVWRYVAAVVGDRPVVTARLLYDAAPFGVRYLAGWWLL